MAYPSSIHVQENIHAQFRALRCPYSSLHAPRLVLHQMWSLTAGRVHETGEHSTRLFTIHMQTCLCLRSPGSCFTINMLLIWNVILRKTQLNSRIISWDSWWLDRWEIRILLLLRSEQLASWWYRVDIFILKYLSFFFFFFHIDKEWIGCNVNPNAQKLQSGIICLLVGLP